MKLLFFRLLGPTADWWPVIPFVFGNENYNSWRQGMQYTWVDIPDGMEVSVSSPRTDDQLSAVVSAVMMEGREVIANRKVSDEPFLDGAFMNFELTPSVCSKKVSFPDWPMATERGEFVYIPWNFVGLLFDVEDLPLLKKSGEAYSTLCESTKLLKQRMEERGFGQIEQNVRRRTQHATV